MWKKITRNGYFIHIGKVGYLVLFNIITNAYLIVLNFNKVELKERVTVRINLFRVTKKLINT